MSDSNAKGDRRERELVNALDGAGYAVMRAPASGSATERELPDALAGDGEDFYAIEAKSSGGDHIYLDGEEIEALLYFAQNFGAKPRVAVRFDREEWYFFHPGDLFVTDGGNYRVKRETALAEGEDFASFTGVERSTLAEIPDERTDPDGRRNGANPRGNGDGRDSDGRGGDGRGGVGRDGVGRDGAGRGDDGPSQATLDVLAAFERGDLTLEEAAAMVD